MDEWIDMWMDGRQVDEWIDMWIYGGMDGWMDE